ncbi:MAG TPA: sulfotransferase [Candidatus Limnocylindria bacterium]|nr:sulfotransferase [Candidatus Limnocylindria bacterium]
MTDAARTLDPERLLGTARQLTGLEDFGDPAFREGLQRFLRSAVEDATLNPIGIGTIEGLTIGMLVNRLRYEADLKRHPEILEEPLEPPVVIVGLPRTGTTKLHRMMAVDERFQSIRAWQTLNPAPFPNAPKDGPDPRIAVAKQMDAVVETMNPEILAGHPIRAEEVDEETSYLMEMTFEWTLLAMRGELPSFEAWVATRSQVPTYRYLRRMLQYLQWQTGGRGRPYLLKSPLHIAHFDALHEVFPGSLVIHCHRHPAEAATSFMKLAELSRRLMYGAVDRRAVGEWVLRTLAGQMRHYLAQRDALGLRASIVDAGFDAIARRPLDVIRESLARRGWSLRDTVANAMLQWEAGHPIDRFGKFIYAMQDYGMTRADFESAFAGYLERFGTLL